MKSLVVMTAVLAVSLLTGFVPSPSPDAQIPVSPGVEWLSDYLTAHQQVEVLVDGIPYQGDTWLLSDTTYVCLREYIRILTSGAAYRYDTEAARATVTAEGLSLTAKVGDCYLCANGRYLWCAEGIRQEGERLLVPIRAVTAALGGSVGWTAESRTVLVTSGEAPIEAGASFYSEDEVFWLSRIIQAESGGEALLGKVAVGNVVLNRMRSDEFPDTVYEVIFDIRFGVQFSPVASGSVYKMPQEESVIAAKLCLDGAEINREMLYFYNPRKSKSTWMRENCTFIASIGNHDFFA